MGYYYRKDLGLHFLFEMIKLYSIFFEEVNAAMMKKIVLCVMAVCCLAVYHADYAQANDWWIFVGAGTGTEDAAVGDLTLRTTFDSFYENDWVSVQPLAEISLNYWHHDSDDEIVGGTLSGGLLVVFQREGWWRPYVSGTFGGRMQGGHIIGTHDLGQSFQFRSKAAVGVQFGETFRHSLQLDAAHFSHAHMNNDNDGFNMFMVSYGFRF